MEACEAGIETASCIDYLAKNDLGSAGRATAKEVDRRGCANSTHYIERRTICESGDDATAAADSQMIRDVEGIGRRVEFEGADASPAERRNRRRRPRIEYSGSGDLDNHRVPVARVVPAKRARRCRWRREDPPYPGALRRRRRCGRNHRHRCQQYRRRGHEPAAQSRSARAGVRAVANPRPTRLHCAANFYATH